MKKLIKKYFIDILLISGVMILSYNILIKPGDMFTIDLANYHIKGKIIGIFLILIGVDLAIRKYINYKKSQI